MLKVDYENLIDRIDLIVDFDKPVRTRKDKIPVTIDFQIWKNKNFVGNIGEDKIRSIWFSNGYYISWGCGGNLDLENY